jgi:hypothetical protein
MSTQRAYERIGQTVAIRMRNGILVDVRILDYEKKWGKDRFYVEPVAGKGRAWVELDDLKSKKAG